MKLFSRIKEGFGKVRRKYSSKQLDRPMEDYRNIAYEEAHKRDREENYRDTPIPVLKDFLGIQKDRKFKTHDGKDLKTVNSKTYYTLEQAADHLDIKYGKRILNKIMRSTKIKTYRESGQTYVDAKAINRLTSQGYVSNSEGIGIKLRDLVPYSLAETDLRTGSRKNTEELFRRGIITPYKTGKGFTKTRALANSLEGRVFDLEQVDKVADIIQRNRRMRIRRERQAAVA